MKNGDWSMNNHKAAGCNPTVYGPGFLPSRGIQELERFLPRASQPEGSILDRAKTRLDWIEKELARIDGLRAEAEQLRRMIAAGESTKTGG